MYKPKSPQPNLFPTFEKWQQEKRLVAAKSGKKHE